VSFINANSRIPDSVDSLNLYHLYKKEGNKDADITFVYFEHYENIIDKDNVINWPIDYSETYQFNDYTHLDYKNTTPVMKKYFSPSKNILNTISQIEKKYALTFNYHNICVLYYRGNDKARETQLSCYDEYVKYANQIVKKNPKILFLIQSDETEFIDFMSEKFPNNSFYFKHEIRHIKKSDTSVDCIMSDKNFEFSQKYLAITIIMSRCNYIICGSGNCSIWIMLYRGNCNNVIQYLNGDWIVNLRN
jgi:hypothetical protein